MIMLYLVLTPVIFVIGIGIGFYWKDENDRKNPYKDMKSSKCCKSAFEVHYEADGTCYYLCLKCGEGCDPR